ncbi:Arc family DNA-binding protein [Stutzerimonas stutzeri]|uniref:Arc family DNA-binding protein n=1 Tax=Stutzerimonas stutzeri TaxID=316 RepID=UPI0015E411F0|nr:Arc family DNA-binding protein [Stutzerimonas stutzeri]MBA1278132.1 Arc family DNA-binding protein [Stutzerimonas stutzeri]
MSSRTADKFVVRLPDGMRDRIAEVANQGHRSMNSEIVERLARSFEADQAAANLKDQLIRQMSDRIRELEARV